MDHSNDFPRVEVDSKGDILHLIKTLKQVTTDKLAAKAEKRRANEQQVELAKQLVEEVLVRMKFYLRFSGSMNCSDWPVATLP